MKIIKQKSTQIIMLPHEQLPFEMLANRKYFELLIQRYSFGQVDQIRDPNGTMSSLLFSNGLYHVESSPDVAIQRLSVESRKVVIAIEGATSYAEKMWGEIREALHVVTPTNDNNDLTPVLVTNESEIMAHLDFPAGAFFSSPFDDFFQKEVIEKTSSSLATSHIGSSGVSFSIDYVPETDMPNDRRINLVRKEFNIKTAIGYPVNDQIYSSSGPISTDVHIDLLQHLEKILK
ncbi:MAG: hypothetical protein MUO30_12350 [Anaerolineales bacterium]|nr:hypothetical protein [Anaerolineales bacterium]